MLNVFKQKTELALKQIKDKDATNLNEQSKDTDNNELNED